MLSKKITHPLFIFIRLKLYTSVKDFKPKKATALTIGMFDGVHLGHQSLIRQLTKYASANGMESVLLTLWPHPHKIFKAKSSLNLISLLPTKLNLLENTGIDTVLVQDFTPEFYNLCGETFVRDYLVDQLGMKYILIGHDHTFGKSKSGNIQLLHKLSNELNFKVKQLDALKSKGENISSTLIRNNLLSGRIREANSLLGYPYYFNAKVVPGDRIGRTLGFPTANLMTHPDQLIPSNGVYAVKVKINDTYWPGMLNIGFRPTVSGIQRLQIETHIIGINLDLYGKEIEISFYEFLRHEKKFNGIDELKSQLQIDKENTLDYFMKNI